MILSLNYSDKHRRWNFIFTSFLFWTVIAALFTTKSNFYYTLKGIPTSWLHLSIHHLASAWTWVLAMPLIYFFYKRLLVRETLRLKITGWMLLVAPLVGLLHSFTSLFVDAGFRRGMGYINESVWANLMKMDSILVSGIFDSTIVFLLIICFFYGFDRFNVWNHGELVKADAVKESRLMVKHAGEYVFIESSSLIAVTAEGNYVKLHMEDDRPLMIRETMSSFMKQLDPKDFARVNRSFITNLTYVKSLHHKFNGEYRLVLKNGIETNTSKRYGDSWRQLIA